MRWLIIFWIVPGVVKIVELFISMFLNFQMLADTLGKAGPGLREIGFPGIPKKFLFCPPR